MSASEDKMACSTELILEAVCERIRAMQFPHDVVVNIEKILANPEAYEPLLRKLAFAHPDYFESILREILGQFSVSCPPAKSLGNSLTDFLMGSSLITEIGDWHHGICRVCGVSAWVGPCSICKPCESKF